MVNHGPNGTCEIKLDDGILWDYNGLKMVCDGLSSVCINIFITGKHRTVFCFFVLNYICIAGIKKKTMGRNSLQ